MSVIPRETRAQRGCADAVLAAGILHDGLTTVGALKRVMTQA
jgi:imidazole glycerol phosphate synthase subunit HisF